MAHWRQWHQVSLGPLPAWSSAAPIQPDYLRQCPWSPLLLAPCQWAVLGVSHHSCTRLHKWWIANFVHIQEGCNQMYLQCQCSWHGSHMHLWVVQDQSLLLRVQKSASGKLLLVFTSLCRMMWGMKPWWRKLRPLADPMAILNRLLQFRTSTARFPSHRSSYIFFHCSHLFNYYNCSRTLCINCWVSAFRTELQHLIYLYKIIGVHTCLIR